MNTFIEMWNIGSLLKVSPSAADHLRVHKVQNFFNQLAGLECPDNLWLSTPLKLHSFLSKNFGQKAKRTNKVTLTSHQWTAYLTCSAGAGRAHEATRETVRGTAADEQDPPAPTNPVSLAWHVRTCPVVDTGTVHDWSLIGLLHTEWKRMRKRNFVFMSKWEWYNEKLFLIFGIIQCKELREIQLPKLDTFPCKQCSFSKWRRFHSIRGIGQNQWCMK